MDNCNIFSVLHVDQYLRSFLWALSSAESGIEVLASESFVMLSWTIDLLGTELNLFKWILMVMIMSVTNS